MAVAALVVFAAVFVNSYHYGSTKYGAVYYHDSPRYSLYPYYYNYPSTSYSRYPAGYSSPTYNYPYSYSPLSSSYMYRYGYPRYIYSTYPTTSYPSYSYPTTAYPAGELRGAEGQLCGMIDSQQFGCVYGLVCDYSQAEQAGIGVCAQQRYPYTQ